MDEDGARLAGLRGGAVPIQGEGRGKDVDGLHVRGGEEAKVGEGSDVLPEERPDAFRGPVDHGDGRGKAGAMTETGKRCAGPPPCLNTECFFHGKSAKFPGSGCRCEQETSVEDCPAGRLGDGLGVLLTMETREESDGRRCARRTCGLADTKAGPEGPWATCRAEPKRRGARRKG